VLTLEIRAARTLEDHDAAAGVPLVMPFEVLHRDRQSALCFGLESCAARSEPRFPPAFRRTRDSRTHCEHLPQVLAK
jgi:hypothetical protein